MTGEVSKLGYKRGKTYGSHERVDSTRWVERVRRGEATAINRTTPRVQGLNHRTKKAGRNGERKKSKTHLNDKGTQI